MGAPLLEDPLRAMRVRAERAVPGEGRALRAAAEANLFRGEGWLQLGDDARARGDDAAADRFYASGLRVDPGFGPLWINRADLQRAMGRDDAPLLRRGLGQALPWAADLAYALGLSRWRAGDKTEALAWLSVAIADAQPAHQLAWQLALEDAQRSARTGSK